MKANTGILWIVAVFCVVLAGVYTVWSLIDPLHQRVEWVGTVGLLLAGVLAGFIAFFLMLVHRKQGGELPEDTLTASIDDGDPELGHFSPWSWWPLVLAAGAGLLILGFIGQFWISFGGAAVVIIGVVGWVYEYYRGNFAR